MTRWLWLQLGIALLALLSEWALRWGGPRSNRAMRVLLVGGLLAAALPIPRGQVTRLVPVQAAASGLHPLSDAMDTVVSVTAPAHAGLSWMPLLAGMAVVGLMGMQVMARARMLRRSRIIRRLGRVTVAVDPQLAAPCTLWMGRHWIVLDPITAADRTQCAMAVRHEARHIRHGDTRFAWVSALLLAVCAPNPAAWRLSRNLADLDELAVDHVLVHEQGVPARAYGQLLLERAVAGPWIHTTPSLVTTSSLRRRLTDLRRRRSPRFWPWLLAAVAVLGVARAADLPWAPVRVAPARSTLGMAPHPVLDAAVAELTETTEGRAFVRRALERRDRWAPGIEDALRTAGLPVELEAVAFLESGYDPKLSLETGPSAAGLWMFIPETARRYGLVVDATRDDRLDPDLETAAAVALLSDLHREFGDWGLALSAYNQGSDRVRRAIAEGGTRDVPTLIEQRRLGDYPALVWASLRVIEGSTGSPVR